MSIGHGLRLIVKILPRLICFPADDEGLNEQIMNSTRSAKERQMVGL